MPSETGNRVSDGILFVISKRGSLNIPTLFLPFWGILQRSRAKCACLRLKGGPDA
ncbi:TPA: hypothetical protein ACH1O3_001284 [Neisseria meningitidis]